MWFLSLAPDVLSLDACTTVTFAKDNSNGFLAVLGRADYLVELKTWL